MKQLTNKEIVATVVGRRFSPASAETTIFRSTTLLPNGRAILEGARAPAEGDYVITDGIVCISFPSGNKRCAKFYRDVDGHLFQELTDNPGVFTVISFE